MYSDFFDQIDAARGGRRGGRSDSSPAANEPPSLVSFKAGKIKMVEQPGSSALKCEADTLRGEVRLVWTDSKLYWQWYDRRAKKVIDKVPITEDGSTFERIDLSYSKQHKDDRVYVWTHKKEDGSYKYDMYWMQDANAEKDDEIVAQVNQYLSDPASAAPEGETAEGDSNANAATSNEGRSGGTAGAAGNSQVDALSSILENLGMPQGEGGASGTASGASSGAGGNQLTLADLQGAMAGIQQQQQVASAARAAGPPLNELVTPAAVTAILESDDAAKQRLIQLLPEGQQTEQQLAENLRSPQVQQTLRSLTQALLPDDNGDLSGYASVIANFSLEPADGQDALAAGNPIQAFLDCVVKSVEKEKKKEEEGEGKQDE